MCKHKADSGRNYAEAKLIIIVSSNPPMISLAVQRPQGRLKDTARHIHHQQQFVVHIVDEDNVK